MEPFFSIIIPTFNSKYTINETLICLSKQTFKDFEIIIGDDGSKDGTIEVIKNNFISDNKINTKNNLRDKIKIYKFSHSGLTKTLNKCLKKSKAKYAVRLDSDDLFSPNYLNTASKLINHELSLQNKYFLIVSNYKTFSNISKPKKRNRLMYFLASSKFGIFLPISWFNHSGSIFPIKANKEKIFYDENFKFSQDRDLWLRLLRRNFKIIFLKKENVFIRQSSQQIGQKNTESQRCYRNLAIALHFHYEKNNSKLNQISFDKIYKISLKIDRDIRKFFTSRFCIDVKMSLIISPILIFLYLKKNNVVDSSITNKY
ncbi:glycosyltransferase family 2 protein [Prochlorococcus marinus]|uniref:glycosyltransferase family 2 protein n=1 Tax=Prochlorococcus marinus TaxID=1219 RepID=UPI001ADCC903|nr:glycosyltransferase family 2 protein [Prochlorococcus marinus]MBO8219550.1 glycosyltransferase family 2 protein [Prochlorococcus marinus CUG1416]MBW3051921.1 hypothetical protein [Prochlorococcus marinus str. MU1416]